MSDTGRRLSQMDENRFSLGTTPHNGDFFSSLVFATVAHSALISLAARGIIHPDRRARACGFPRFVGVVWPSPLE